MANKWTVAPKDWATIKRNVIFIGVPMLIVWFGTRTLERIQDLYETDCAALSERGGECIGIYAELDLLYWLVFLCAGSTFAAMVFWRAFSDAWDRERHTPQP